MGHVGFLNGLFEEIIPGQTEDQKLLKELLLRRDVVGYRAAVQQLFSTNSGKGADASEEAQNQLEAILRLRGGKEICDQATELSSNPLAVDSVSHLCKVWEVLEAYGVSEHVLIDLTMIGDFSYYTGMIFEGYAAGIGSPVASGGRYDNLLQQFGRDVPATGFALKTNRIVDGMEEQQVTEQHTVFIRYDAESRREALTEATRLREAGKVVITGILGGTADTEASATAYTEIITYEKGLATRPGI